MPIGMFVIFADWLCRGLGGIMPKMNLSGTGSTTLTAEAPRYGCSLRGLLVNTNAFAGVPGCAELLVGIVQIKIIRTQMKNH